MKPAALIVSITVVLVAAIALIIAGIAFGGGWRWASAVVTGLGIAAIVGPGFIKDKNEIGDRSE